MPQLEIEKILLVTLDCEMRGENGHDKVAGRNFTFIQLKGFNILLNSNRKKNVHYFEFRIVS